VDIAELKNNVPILLVEDDQDDIELVKRAFRKGRILNELYVVRDGQQALEFLYHTGRYTNQDNAPRPGIILLDLNMPGVTGQEVLEKIKTDTKLRRIPVIILTTSSSHKEIRESYEHGANTFIIKPVEFNKFLEAVITLGKYWLNIAEVPNGDRSKQDRYFEMSGK